MRIGTFVRTFRDFEEKTIEQFIESHAWCDTIYVGLCETSPKTMSVIRSYRRGIPFLPLTIETRDFNELAYLPDGTYHAHEGAYYKFLNDWSQEKEEELDFVIFDDADHIVSPSLQRDARRILEEFNPPYAYSLLMYVWGTEHYFPELNKCCPQERLWGWNPKKWQPDINPEHPTTVEIKNQPDRDIDKGFVFPHPPYALLHYSWLTEDDTLRKMAFNHARGVAQGWPPDTCGRLEPIPEWARK